MRVFLYDSSILCANLSFLCAKVNIFEARLITSLNQVLVSELCSNTTALILNCNTPYRTCRCLHETRILKYNSKQEIQLAKTHLYDWFVVTYSTLYNKWAIGWGPKQSTLVCNKKSLCSKIKICPRFEAVQCLSGRCWDMAL